MQILFFQGMDNIISFVLCSILGCVVLPWWTGKPVPAVIFSACHKCCFCILRRAGTLWSFDSAQQGRGGQAAEVPNIHRQFKGRWWEVNGLVFSPLPHSFIHLPALCDQGTPNTHPHIPSVRIRNKNSNSYRKWDSQGRTGTKCPVSKQEDGILLEITGTSSYQGRKMSCSSCCHLSMPFVYVIPSFSTPFPSGSWGIPHFFPNNLKRPILMNP